MRCRSEIGQVFGRRALFGLPLACAAPLAQAQEHLPRVIVIGDSTARNGEGLGWGDHFAAYLDAAAVGFENRAMAGRSSRTFREEGRWTTVRDSLRAGDTVLIQFGHNDGGPVDTDKARGSLPGIGEESTAAGVHTFGWYLRQYIREAKERGARPVVLAPTVRNIWREGRVERALGRMPDWAAQVAAAEGVPFLDLANAIANEYERQGEEETAKLFPKDHTHTSVEGARRNAAVVAACLKGRVPLPWNAAATTIQPYRQGPEMPTPRHPLNGPADPKLPTLWLLGDSTVRNGNGDGVNGQWGWGELLPEFLDSGKRNIVNRAMGGLSSRTYLTLGHWDLVRKLVKAGDVVTLQFGHNDAAALDDKARARGTIAGNGEEAREILNPIRGCKETVHTYGWYLRKIAGEAQQAGAKVVVLSPVPRKQFREGKVLRPANSYPQWAKLAAAQAGVEFRDLFTAIAAEYDALGPAAVEPLFSDEHTHTSREGARRNARVVARLLEGLV